MGRRMDCQIYLRQLGGSEPVYGCSLGPALSCFDKLRNRIDLELVNQTTRSERDDQSWPFPREKDLGIGID